MILVNSQPNVIVGYSAEDSKETSFKYSMNAKSFKALSDGLYKNKIGSIIFEKMIININNKGRNIPQEKIDSIRLVREMSKDKFSTKTISEVTGYSPRQVGRIISGEAWKDVT